MTGGIWWKEILWRMGKEGHCAEQQRAMPTLRIESNLTSFFWAGEVGGVECWQRAEMKSHEKGRV